MIFQDPYSSLNPRRTVGAIIGEPLRIQRHRLEGSDAVDAWRSSWSGSGSTPSTTTATRTSSRAVSGSASASPGPSCSTPKLIVADEPVSALDVSIQAQILNLLEDLQASFGLTYLFIAHDLDVVRHVSDRVAVMYLGKIVELAAGDGLYSAPVHPYTEALLSAVPVPDPSAGRGRATASSFRATCRARSRPRPAAVSTPAAATRPRSAPPSSRPSSSTAGAGLPPATIL